MQGVCRLPTNPPRTQGIYENSGAPTSRSWCEISDAVASDALAPDPTEDFGNDDDTGADDAWRHRHHKHAAPNTAKTAMGMPTANPITSDWLVDEPPHGSAPDK